MREWWHQTKRTVNTHCQHKVPVFPPRDENNTLKSKLPCWKHFITLDGQIGSSKNIQQVLNQLTYIRRPQAELWGLSSAGLENSWRLDSRRNSASLTGRLKLAFCDLHFPDATGRCGRVAQKLQKNNEYYCLLFVNKCRLLVLLASNSTTHFSLFSYRQQPS